MSTLFAEPRVGKAWAKRLEGDLRSQRNYKHIYFLLAGTGNETELYQRITHRGQAVLGKVHGLTSARVGLGKPDFCLMLAGPGQHQAGEKEVHISVFMDDTRGAYIPLDTHTSSLVWTLTRIPEVPFGISHSHSHLIPAWSPGLDSTGHRKFQGDPRSQPSLLTGMPCQPTGTNTGIYLNRKESLVLTASCQLPGG